MAKQPTSFRLSSTTIWKIKELTKEYGTEAEVVSMAVERMFEEQMRNRVEQLEAALDFYASPLNYCMSGDEDGTARHVVAERDRGRIARAALGRPEPQEYKHGR